MNSNIESTIVQAINRHNASTLGYEGNCPCDDLQFFDVTRVFDPLHLNEPDMIITAQVCKDCGLIHDAQIAGISCQHLHNPEIVSESKLAHHSFSVSFKPIGEWNNLYCDPYLNGGEWSFYFKLSFVVSCRDCGKVVTTVTVYICFRSRKDLFSSSVIHKLQDAILKAKDDTLQYFSSSDTHFRFEPEVDLSAATLSETIGFPYKNIHSQIKDTVANFLQLPSVDDYSFHRQVVLSPGNQILFFLEKDGNEQ